MTTRNRRRIAAGALTLAAAATLAACGTAAGDQTATDETDPVAAAEPVEQTLTLDEAGERYLEIVAPYNAAQSEAQNLASAQRDREACATVVEPSRTFAYELRAAPWPDSVAPLADELADLEDGRADVWERCAAAPTDEDAYAETLEYPQSDLERGADLANAIRTVTGLPSVAP